MMSVDEISKLYKFCSNYCYPLNDVNDDLKTEFDYGTVCKGSILLNGKMQNYNHNYRCNPLTIKFQEDTGGLSIISFFTV